MLARQRRVGRASVDSLEPALILLVDVANSLLVAGARALLALPLQGWALTAQVPLLCTPVAGVGGYQRWRSRQKRVAVMAVVAIQVEVAEVAAKNRKIQKSPVCQTFPSEATGAQGRKKPIKTLTKS